MTLFRSRSQTRLQGIFLQTLAEDPVLKERNLTVFMTTHSSHLLGMALSEMEKVSVFAFQKWRTYPERFLVRPVHTRRQSLLSLLGVANSSVFLANCGVWVEGVTDRKYLRAYLAAYLESDEVPSDFVPQEDVHYAFFEYAGSNLVHYLFGAEDDAALEQVEEIRARFLCNRIFLLADQDEDREKKHARLEEWQNDGFHYHVTPGVEVENLISAADLRQVLPQLIPGLSAKQVTSAKLRFKDFQEKRLGAYLKDKLGKHCPDALVAASGTLSAYYKGKLADLACQHVTWDDMSEDARQLARELYDFTYTHNRGAPKQD